MHVELSTGLTLAVDHYGDPAATPLVLLHGLSNSRRTYAPVVTHLIDQYVSRGALQVLNTDLRGHGGSDRASLDSYDATSYAADVASLIEQTVGQPAIVVGHSLGGVVAATLATQRPDLTVALLLEDPPLFEGDAEIRAKSPTATYFPTFLAAVQRLQAAGAPAGEYAELMAPSTAPEELADRCASLHEWDPTTMQAALDGILWHGYDPEEPLAVPVTVLRADPAVGAAFGPDAAARMARSNPEALIVHVPGAAHSIHAAATRAQYLAELDRFLRSV